MPVSAVSKNSKQSFTVIIRFTVWSALIFNSMRVRSITPLNSFHFIQSQVLEQTDASRNRLFDFVFRISDNSADITMV